ncbi:tRNA uridine-5-carboxymethylaminomethyl(34) synthesis GTPase MnmE [Balneolaceae bacterium ANBcel3]|nr:tRNA uridine-5-carboxymethylaminomethyl(34) synthesis GTPase MnmE [Balneolaceae bacterium ANBcel3]
MQKNQQATREMDSVVQKDPIAAVATAPGEAGISVLRVSGEQAIEKVNRAFKGKDLASQKTHTVHFGKIIDGEQVVDEVLVTIFRSPASYTGEDTVEVSCHGGVLVTQRVLEALLKQDIRHAEPGEFTQRAFLNGKLELSQAEAVADLIHAKSMKAVEAAGIQLQGALGKHIAQFRQQIIDATAMVELELDFIEEDVEFASQQELLALLQSVDDEMGRLIDTYESGRLVKYGVQTVFVGRPNVGKSTLLNTLIGKERAIVSATAGTTRDTIDADWNYEGITFTLTDTAGLRETADEIEAEGVSRSESAINNADLILFLKDVSEELMDEELRLLEKIRNRAEKKVLLHVGTKADLVEKVDSDLYDVTISAKTGEGVEELKKNIKDAVLKGKSIDTGKLLVTSVRHRDALQKARSFIRSSMEALQQGVSGELLAIDLRAALHELGAITGEITTEDILDSVFSRFCIGK